MNLVGSSGVQAALAGASTAAQDATGSAAQVLLLKKALHQEAAGAVALIEALPQPPLASSGSLGRNVNVYA